jgi:hypothetical protein
MQNATPCYDKTQAELDLLEAIALPELYYPWNPTLPEAEHYLDIQEKEFSLSDWLTDKEISQRAKNLFSHFDQIWSRVSLEQSLLEKFAPLVPHDLLNALVKSVKEVASQYQSLADRMVQSVLTILPQWNEEDLEVLARPLAYAMREADLNPLDTVLKCGKCWTELSEIEQARLSLVIARYTLYQLSMSD